MSKNKLWFFLNNFKGYWFGFPFITQ